LFLIGFYLNISASVRWTYDTLNSYLQGPATGIIFSIPLLIFAYIIGAVNTTLATLLYDSWCKPYNDEYMLLDAIEARQSTAVLPRRPAVAYLCLVKCYGSIPETKAAVL
jgi:hypothetical protein